MAPITQNNSKTPDKKPPPRPVGKKVDLLVKPKFENKLPDIPSDLKFISYPFNSRRFIPYKLTSLERTYKFQNHPDYDLGINIDLVDKDKYSSDNNATMHPADEELLEEDIFAPQCSKRSRDHAKNVSWLRRTEYISTEQTRFQPHIIDKVEAKIGFNINKNFKKETLYTDRDSQMKAIEKTFDDSKNPIEKHYSKPNVNAVEILDVYPDFKNWKYPCAQVIFDSDPAPKDRPVPEQIEDMSRAMIRGVMDENGEQFVAYFLPSKETVAKRHEDAVKNIPYDDDFEYDYTMTKEYNWNVKSKSSQGYEENYFLIERPDGVFYNELETRVRLSKRRQKIGIQSTNTKLIVQHVPINEQEHNVHKLRENQLRPYDENVEAVAVEESNTAIIASNESEEKKAINIKTDSDDFIKIVSKMVVASFNGELSDEIVDQETAVNFKHRNSETVNGSVNGKKNPFDDSVNSNSDEKEMDKKSQQSAISENSNSDSSGKKSSHFETNFCTPSNVSSGNEDKSDGEDKKEYIESSLSDSGEELKDKPESQKPLILESNNSDVDMRNNKSLKHAEIVANSESLESPTISEHSGPYIISSTDTPDSLETPASLDTPDSIRDSGSE